MSPSIEEQFAILSSRNGSELHKAAIQKYLGGEWMRRAELFTLTPDEFRAWCDKQDISIAGAMLNPASSDGLYLIQQGSEWLVYWQERGGKSHEQKFTTEVDAKRAAIYARLKDEFLLKDGLL